MTVTAMLRSAVAAGAILLSTAVPSSAAPMASISIVDAPRPEPKWGYAPGTRKVAPGTWVTWSNAGQDVHTVTAADASFDSGVLQPSDGFSWFFSDPGTFSYICTLHPWMVGKIIVGDGKAPAPVVTDPAVASTNEGSMSDAAADAP